MGSRSPTYPRESPLTVDALPRECQLISFNSFGSPLQIVLLAFLSKQVLHLKLFLFPFFKQFTNLLLGFFHFCNFHLTLCSCSVVTLRSYITTQVGAYHSSRVQCTRASSALTWWHEHETLWPLCTIIAKHTLCVPASSATSERSFSKTGHIMRSRRRRLNDAHVRELSFISWNADLLES